MSSITVAPEEPLEPIKLKRQLTFVAIDDNDQTVELTIKGNIDDSLISNAGGIDDAWSTLIQAHSKFISGRSIDDYEWSKESKD